MSGDRSGSPHASASERPPAVRSRVTNGSALFLQGVDGRSATARRFRDVYLQVLSDLGTEATSEAQRQIARRCAALAVRAELMEAALARGDDFELDDYLALTNATVRAHNALGLKRVPKRVHEATAQDWVHGNG